MYKKLLIAVVMIFMVGGCSRFGMIGMPKPPTDGSPEYIAGWEDGCETGTTAYSNGYLRIRNKTSVNPEMMQNNDYNKGWRLGNNYCMYYTARYMSLGYFDNQGKGSDLKEDDTWINESEGLSLFKGWHLPEAF